MGMNTDAVQRLYVAYFNRPADPVSLSVYESLLPSDRVATQAELQAIAETYFSPSPEYVSLYDGLSNAQIVDQLYQNIFGRSAEPTGLIFWAGELTSGAQTVASLALQLSFSAQGTDAAVVANRIEAANAFTTSLDTTEEITGYAGDAAAASARAWLATVGSDDASKDAAIADVDTAVNNAINAGDGQAPSQTAVLTVGQDSFTGGAGDDVIDGVTNANPGGVNVATLTAIDVLNGGAGDDTIILGQGALVDAAFSNLTSIEKMFTNGAVTLGVNANAMGLEEVTTTGTGGLTLSAGYNKDFSYSALVNAIDSVDFQNQATGTQMRVTVDESGVGNGLGGNITVQAEDSSGAVTGGISTLDDEGTTLSSSTDATLTFDVRSSDGTSRGTFTQVHLGDFLTGGDSNAAPVGANTIYVASGAGADSLRGGAGNDYLSGGADNDTAATNGGNDTVEGGTGNDVITGGAGNEVLGGGDGNDSITIGGGSDNASAGDGNDTIVAAGNFNSADTIAAGDGTDVMTMTTAMADTNFGSVTGLEAVAVTGNLAHTIGTTAEAAGIRSVTMDAAAVADTLSATTYTTAITVDMSGAGNDLIQLSNADNTVSFGSTDELVASTGADSIAFGSGTDTIRADVDGTNATSGTIDLDQIIGLESVVVNASTGTDVVTVQFDAVTTTTTETITVDGAALTGGTDSLTVTNNAGTNSKFFNITGGVGNDTLQGGANVTGATGDTLSGGTGNDSLTGQNGNDSILGGAGSDTITVGTGSVNVSGGDANDTINMAATLTVADTVDGGSGTDIMTVTAALGTAADAAFANVSSVESLQLGGGGLTTLGANAQAAGITAIALDTGNNAETVNLTAYTTAVTVDMSGQGDDQIQLSNTTGNIVSFSSNDELDAGAGNDSINLGSGSDTIRADVDGTNPTTGTIDLDQIAGLENIVVNGSTGTDVVALTFDAVTSSTTETITIDGTDLTGVSDTIAITNNVGAVDKRFNITGGAAGDTLAGAQGTALSGDTLAGGTGNDSLVGNGGLDVLQGDAGNDTIIGGASNDLINGGAGSDAITANAGNDTIDGGDSDDTITMGANFTFDDQIDGGAQGSGGDTLSVNGGVTDVNFLNTSNIENLTLATAGDNRLGFRAEAAGVTTVTSIDTQDTVGASTYTTGLAVIMSNGSDSIATGSGNDTLTFDSTDEMDQLDTINFGSGSDTLTNTAVAATANTATLDLDNVSGLESLVLAGTTGDDVTTVQFDAVTGAVTSTLTVDASSHITANDQLIMANNSNLATVNFNVTGSSVGQNTLQGGAGADTLVGGAANDSIIANAGNDTFDMGRGTDTINAGAGNDTIDAGAGADSILASVGSDRITGGAGVDTYVLSQANTSKFVYTTITDLTFGPTAAERDVLTFDSAADTNVETFNTTAISLGTNATFADYLDAGTATAGSEGELSWFQFGGNTYIVQDNSSNTSFDVANGDIVVELVGLLDLSTMTVGDGTLT